MKSKINGTTLFQVVLTGILFLIGAQILDLSLVDMAMAIEQMLAQITG